MPPPPLSVIPVVTAPWRRPEEVKRDGGGGDGETYIVIYVFFLLLFFFYRTSNNSNSNNNNNNHLTNAQGWTKCVVRLRGKRIHLTASCIIWYYYYYYCTYRVRYSGSVLYPLRVYLSVLPLLPQLGRRFQRCVRVTCDKGSSGIPRQVYNASPLILYLHCVSRVLYARIPPTQDTTRVDCCWLLATGTSGAPDAPPPLSPRPYRRRRTSARTHAPLAHPHPHTRAHRYDDDNTAPPPAPHHPPDRRSVGGGGDGDRDGPVLPVRVPDAHNNWRASSVFVSSARGYAIRDTVPAAVVCEMF